MTSNALFHASSISAITESGCWSTDNARGREYAALCVEDVRVTGAPSMIGKALRDIATSGRYGGVEVGFSAGVAGAIS